MKGPKCFPTGPKCCPTNRQEKPRKVPHRPAFGEKKKKEIPFETRGRHIEVSQQFKGVSNIGDDDNAPNDKATNLEKDLRERQKKC